MEVAHRLSWRDAISTGTIGLRTRRLRATLSALGIAIGVASMVGVLSLSESSKADLIATLDRLGTNLLTVEPGTQIFGGAAAKLPPTAPRMIERIGPVHEVSSVGSVEGATVRRNDLIDEGVTGGINVVAADSDLLETLDGRLAEGSFLSRASSCYPTVVLGAIAAERLGFDSLSGKARVLIDDHWFTVIGVLRSVPLTPVIDRSALIGWGAAVRYLGAERTPSLIYVRTSPDHLEEVRGVLGATASPAHPEEVKVSRPSDALAARIATKSVFTGLFLGLGAVALLVGGIGIANVMVISVLERRSEIGLRRALGATKRHVRVQFLSEALLLSGAGGVMGVALGALVTLVYATSRGWHSVVPLQVMIGGPFIAVMIGVIAGIYPASRAARLSPTDALRSV